MRYALFSLLVVPVLVSDASAQTLDDRLSAMTQRINAIAQQARTPTQAERISALEARLMTVFDELATIQLAMSQGRSSDAPASPRLAGQAPLGQAANTFLVGQQPLTVTWDASPDAQWYETGVNVPPATTVNATSWRLPMLVAGSHTVRVRACNREATTQAVQCSAEATATLTLVNPTPPPSAPGNIRIVPADKVLSAQEIRQLADAFSYVHRLVDLRPQEIAALQAQYNGPQPITYGSELEFLNAQLLALMSAR